MGVNKSYVILNYKQAHQSQHKRRITKQLENPNKKGQKAHAVVANSDYQKRHKASKGQKTQAIKEQGGRKEGHKVPQKATGQEVRGVRAPSSGAAGVPSPPSEGSEPECGSPGAQASQRSAEDHPAERLCETRSPNLTRPLRGSAPTGTAPHR